MGLNDPLLGVHKEHTSFRGVSRRFEEPWDLVPAFYEQNPLFLQVAFLSASMDLIAKRLA